MKKKSVDTLRQKIVFYRPFEQLFIRAISFFPFFRALQKPYVQVSEKWNSLREYRPRAIRYAVAFFSVAFALILRIILNPFLEEQAPFLSFIIAITFSGWYGGFGPGMFATLLSIVAGTILFIEPVGSIHVLSTGEVVRISLFAIIGVFISTLNGTLRYVNKQVINTLESIGDAFFSIDRSFRYTYINAQMIQYLHKSPEDVIGATIFKIIPTFKDSIFHKKFMQAMKQKKHVKFEAYSAYSKKWLEVDTYSSREGLSVFFRDVTERKSLEQKRDEFVSIASHELKTPLTTIKAFAQILEKRFTKSKDIRDLYFIKNINTNIDKLTTLVNDLLDVSKIQAGKLVLYQKEFNIDHLIQKVVRDMHYITENRPITIENKAHKKVQGDEERIGQVLINLITNAIKYSLPESKIVIKASYHDKHVVVSVQDFGIGIPPDKQKLIFERFFRAVDVASQGPSGFGLGLYISRDIIRRHGGKIWVESKVGKGSTFYFTIPINK